MPVPFAYSRADDLHLVLTDAAGNETPVTDNYQVSVTQAGDTGIVYPLAGSPLAPGMKLTVYRGTPRTQIVAAAEQCRDQACECAGEAEIPYLSYYINILY
ncbi:MAG: hypothetical protein LBQ10_06440, partial [Desulfovibrio sp.]|jgi:hypothetical protein|nr:hypothetical protein [Desulfovibrio sp.]